MNDRPIPQILVVEDERHLAMGLKLNLELEGYEVSVAETGRDAGRLLLDRFDLVVLDVMLPDMSGFDLCRRLREAGDFTPVIMLTARGAPEDRVTGLEAGADDYLPKPFELAELLARVASLLRRRRWEQHSEPAPPVADLQFSDVRVDFNAHTVERGGAPITVTTLELDLLRYFGANPARVLSRGELLEHVWKLSHHNNTRSVDNFVMRLRRLLEIDPKRPRHFVSVRGAGYKFEP